MFTAAALSLLLSSAEPRLCAAVTLSTAGSGERVVLPGVEVRLFCGNDSPKIASTDEKGLACFEGNFSGQTVTFRVTGGALGDDAEYQYCVRRGTAPVPITFYEPSPALIADCAWGEAGPPQSFTLTGVVRDSTGQAVRGAKVTLKDKRFREQQWAVRTDDLGRYRIDNVRFGRFDFTVIAKGFLTRISHFVRGACEGGPSTVDVELSRCE